MIGIELHSITQERAAQERRAVARGFQKADALVQASAKWLTAEGAEATSPPTIIEDFYNNKV